MTNKTDVLQTLLGNAVAREIAEFSALQNVLATASTDARPVFTDGASKAVDALLATRARIAGLQALISEVTP